MNSVGVVGHRGVAAPPKHLGRLLNLDALPGEESLADHAVDFTLIDSALGVPVGRVSRERVAAGHAARVTA